MDKSFDEVMKLTQEEFYKITTDYNPTYNLLKLCRNHGYFYMGYFIGSILKPTNKYEYLDELEICAFYVGEYQESLNICNFILENKLCPEKDIERIKQNKQYSENQLRAEHGIYD